jgi:dihydroflavonol-4-reductase
VGERYILGGENLTYHRIAAIICELVGRPAPRLTIPAWALGPVASIVDAYNRVNPRPPVVSGEQLRLAAFKVFYDSSKAVAELGYPLLPFRPAAERAYRWYREHDYIP